LVVLFWRFWIFRGCLRAPFLSFSWLHSEVVLSCFQDTPSFGSCLSTCLLLGRGATFMYPSLFGRPAPENSVLLMYKTFSCLSPGAGRQPTKTTHATKQTPLWRPAPIMSSPMYIQDSFHASFRGRDTQPFHVPICHFMSKGVPPPSCT
jgi:hypothetical protein